MARRDRVPLQGQGVGLRKERGRSSTKMFPRGGRRNKKVVRMGSRTAVPDKIAKEEKAVRRGGGKENEFYRKKCGSKGGKESSLLSKHAVKGKGKKKEPKP